MGAAGLARGREQGEHDRASYPFFPSASLQRNIELIGNHIVHGRAN